jgi:hypothetical protein
MTGKQKALVNDLGNIQLSVEEGRYGTDDDIDFNSLEEDLNEMITDIRDSDSEEEE